MTDVIINSIPHKEVRGRIFRQNYFGEWILATKPRRIFDKAMAAKKKAEGDSRFDYHLISGANIDRS